jgi:hypothetical protein
MGNVLPFFVGVQLIKLPHVNSLILPQLLRVAILWQKSFWRTYSVAMTLVRSWPVMLWDRLQQDISTILISLCGVFKERFPQPKSNAHETIFKNYITATKRLQGGVYLLLQAGCEVQRINNGENTRSRCL